MGRTRSQPNKQTNKRVKKIRLSVWNGNLPQNISERLSKAESRGLLSSAAVVGRVEKSAKSMPGSHLSTSGLAPRLQQIPNILVILGNFPNYRKKCDVNIWECGGYVLFMYYNMQHIISRALHIFKGYSI